ncbi:MAG: adenylate/guanylate cyclase domain-containing protein [Verrucomicrobiales bacterium]
MKLERHIAHALTEMQLEVARRLGWLRAAGVAAFAALITAMVHLAGHADWQPIFWPTLIYAGLAAALGWGAASSPRIRRASRFAVPVFDLPAVFLIQWIHLGSTDDPSAVASFSLALFVCLILLATFTIDRRHIAASALIAIALCDVLGWSADSTVAARLGNAIVLAFATWVCLFASSNRIEMARRSADINARRLRLQRYFSPGVGELLESRDEDSLTQGYECEISVLFADIRGFTAMSQRLQGPEVVAMLNTFHGLMVEEIFRHGGTVDKYLGDGLMVYFNAPIGQADHAERAVRCALAMNASLERLNAEAAPPAAGFPAIECRIGISTGRAVIGDIGAPHRRSSPRDRRIGKPRKPAWSR